MQVYRTTLENNLRTLLIDTGGAESATVLLLVGAGSRYETAANNGIAHFFEHMAFKGSAKYPDSFTISSTIEGMGGVFNAFTSKDHTGYWIKGVAEKVPLMLDVLADMVTSPKLESAEIEKEKGVIIEEMNMYEDMPTSKVSQIYDALLFGAHPLGMDIIGTKETVSSFTRETFTSYIEKLYFPENAVLVVAGGIQKNLKNIEKSVEKTFGPWKSDAQKHDTKRSVFATQKDAQKITVFEKKTEQAHFILGYTTDFGFRDTRKYQLGALAAILGGGMSSRLFIEVREKRGLCYYVHTSRDMYEETGSLVTAAGIRCDKKTVNEAVALIRSEHSKALKESMTHGGDIAADLARVKQMMKGRFLLSLEDSQSVASFYGNKLLMEGDTMTPEEVIERIDTVSLKDVHSIAEAVVDDNLLRFALVGPFTKDDVQL